VNSADHTPVDIDLLSELVEQHGLSAADVETVRDAIRRTGCSFAEAVRDLGLLKPSEDLAVPKPPTQNSTDTGGVIAATLQRLSHSRELVLRQGGELTPGAELRHSFEAFHPRSEKVRALRTELLMAAEATRHANVVALISACPGEGRSLLAAELAISFAQLGRRTLLVDADLRRPRQHALFGDSNDSGLADALESNVTPVIHPIAGPPRLFFCKAGPVGRNPSETLSDGAFGRVLFEWRSSYEFIVIDTPPLSLSSDALAIASVVGRVLVVARTGHTSFKDMRGVLRRLEGSRAQVLGAVMQDFKSEETASRGWWSKFRRQVVP
jgi:receptor protein-tyrosine kinase